MVDQTFFSFVGCLGISQGVRFDDTFIQYLVPTDCIWMIYFIYLFFYLSRLDVCFVL